MSIYWTNKNDAHRRYKTFKRSCIDFDEFSRAKTRTVETGLTYTEAKKRCEVFNANRSRAQIMRGTKLEFTKE